jgi:hypothetical protein
VSRRGALLALVAAAVAATASCGDRAGDSGGGATGGGLSGGSAAGTARSHDSLEARRPQDTSLPSKVPDARGRDTSAGAP